MYVQGTTSSASYLITHFLVICRPSLGSKPQPGLSFERLRLTQIQSQVLPSGVALAQASLGSVGRLQVFLHTNKCDYKYATPMVYFYLSNNQSFPRIWLFTQKDILIKM